MEKNKNYKIIVFILSIGLILSISLLLMFYIDNQNLERQIVKREKLIKKAVVKDVELSKQKTKNDSIIEHYIDDCGIRVNNKKVSSDELLKLIYSQIKEVEELTSKNSQLNDSLQICQSFVSLTKKSIDVKYNVKKEDNKIISSINIKQDSLNIYKKLYQLMKRDYGIFYSIEENKDSRTYVKTYSKLDSALFVYKHYKHVLSTDSKGNLLIDLPTKKEIRNSTSNRGKK